MIRHIVHTFLFIFFYASTIYSQGWFWQNPLPQGQDLYDVHIFDSCTAIAVGAIGTVIKTTDGGTSWNSQTSGTTVLLESVHFTDNNTGSEIVEAAVDWLEGQINIDAEILELKCTNRYSPGNCEWNVSDQHKLFSFFPDNFCGIEITDSARMTTIKFMSGIIGLSENVKKKTDTCNICSMVNFYIRLQEYE